MGFSQFHFAQGAWLWGLVAIPVVLLLYALFYQAEGAERLERFADLHLLPHLVKNMSVAGKNVRTPLLVWGAAWLCGVIAMAGPRWNYTDQQTFEQAHDLVIVLDLSQSMNVTDVAPSRIARAREEIEDLLDMSRDNSIGLVAYAAVPHMVTPLTDDFRTIKNLLPELDTSLVTIQGDRLKPALEMAAGMLTAEPGDNKSILVISDGSFEEHDISVLAHAAGNATIYTMGVGVTGGPTDDDDDGVLKDGTKPTPRLQAKRLQMLAAAGHGIYVEADYTDSDTRAILSRIAAANAKAQVSTKIVRVWEERFYMPALALGLLLLPFFRRGATFPVILLLAATFLPTNYARANTTADWFLNQNQQAKVAYDGGNYTDAMTKFDTPYQRGVAAYRAKQYDKATLLFKSSAATKPSLNALYDLGNAQLMQDQVEDAIASYRAALKLKSDDFATRHNLAIALKMLAQEQQKQQRQKQQSQNKQGKNSPQSNQQGQQQRKGESQSRQASKQNPASPTANRDTQQLGGPSKADQRTAQQQGQQRQDGQGRAQPRTAQSEAPRPTQPQRGKQMGAPKLQYGAVGMALPRTQRDVNADQWLTRVQSDPGSFLKNQFRIEDQESGLKQETPPR